MLPFENPGSYVITQHRLLQYAERGEAISLIYGEKGMSGAPILGEIHQKLPILTVRCRRTCDWSFERDTAIERSLYFVYID